MLGVETTRGGSPPAARSCGGRPYLASGIDGRVTLPIESHLLQAFVTEPIKPLVDHVITFGAEHFYISQSDKGGLVFGGNIDGFNSYTQRGQFPKYRKSPNVPWR